MDGSADTFGALHGREAAEPMGQLPSGGGRRPDGRLRVENTLQALCGQSAAAVLDGDPHIIARSAPWEFDSRRVIDRVLAGPDDQLSAIRYIVGRLGDEIQDHCGY